MQLDPYHLYSVSAGLEKTIIIIRPIRSFLRIFCFQFSISVPVANVPLVFLFWFEPRWLIWNLIRFSYYSFCGDVDPVVELGFEVIISNLMYSEAMLKDVRWTKF